jgi:hypothetical protein
MVARTVPGGNPTQSNLFVFTGETVTDTVMVVHPYVLNDNRETQWYASKAQ